MQFPPSPVLRSYAAAALGAPKLRPGLQGRCRCGWLDCRGTGRSPSSDWPRSWSLSVMSQPINRVTVCRQTIDSAPSETRAVESGTADEATSPWGRSSG
jgi:hypothetical protein